MPTPFKEKFNHTLISDFASKIAQVYPAFEKDRFVERATQDLNALELKQRSAQITQALHDFMPSKFEHCRAVVEQILHPDDNADMNLADIEADGVRGWIIMPLADFVALRCIPQQFDTGMDLLAKLTRRFSAEFAIRDFIVYDIKRALQYALTWTESDNEHVRRLASEGTRPRLPWGRQLPELILDPAPLTPILTALLDDKSEYVRRSVANNLNDIAKDNPQFVIDFVATNLTGASKRRERLLRHACRTLLKQGNVQVLQLFGYSEFTGTASLELSESDLPWGGTLDMNLIVSGQPEKPQSLIIDYVVWHKKAKGQLMPKVFKWKTIDGWNGEEIKKIKRHSFKPVTTRTYYPGEHKFQIQINGRVVAEKTIELLAQ